MMRQHCFVLLIALVFPHISVAETIPKPFIFVNWSHISRGRSSISSGVQLSRVSYSKLDYCMHHGLKIYGHCDNRRRCSRYSRDLGETRDARGEQREHQGVSILMKEVRIAGASRMIMEKSYVFSSVLSRTAYWMLMYETLIMKKIMMNELSWSARRQRESRIQCTRFHSKWSVHTCFIELI